MRNYDGWVRDVAAKFSKLDVVPKQRDVPRLLVNAPSIRLCVMKSRE
jgi:hypothetical protein